MRIDGEKPNIQTADLALSNTLCVTVKPLPLGFHEELERKLPSPVPPIDGFVTDKNGEPIRDENGQPVPHRNFHDVDYKQRSERISFLQTVIIARTALRDSENIDWDTEPEGGKYDMPKDYEDYAADLAEEMRDALTYGQINAIIRKSEELGGLDEEAVDKAMRNFRSEP